MKNKDEATAFNPKDVDVTTEVVSSSELIGKFNKQFLNECKEAGNDPEYVWKLIGKDHELNKD